MTFAPIAIVGRGCVFPGGLDADAFGASILGGVDLVSEVPDDRWGVELSRLTTRADGVTEDRAYHARGGYVRGFDLCFDPARYRVQASLLQEADPLVRWLCHAGADALKGVSTGDNPKRIASVIGNLGFPSEGLAKLAAYVHTQGQPALRKALGLDAPVWLDRFHMEGPASLMRSALGLEGLSMSLDAACASAFYAIAIAADMLHEGSADVVLAGGANRSDDLFLHVGFTALHALSPSGQSRPFHASADGLLPAEGCAVFALKRLADAVRAQDPIFGVIRGVGLANDGRAGSMLSPSPEGQARAIRSAWARAALDPRAHLGLLECHATGTPVGDRTELQSSLQVFEGMAQIPTGSVKSNMGHAVTAAGGAALLKVLAGLGAGVRPATLHVDDAATIAFGPYRLLKQAEAWDGPRVAGISAFGFGGNDAHVVVGSDVSDAGPVAPVPRAVAREKIAVIGAGVRLAGVSDFPSFVGALANNGPLSADSEGRIDAFDISLKDLRFPPKDLESTLAQHTLLMEAVREALGGHLAANREKAGIFVGMTSDPEVARYGLRWRLAAAEREPARLAALRDGVILRLTSAGVLGTMPNLPANRCSTRFDLGGPGFVVASGRRSGLDALALAVRALQAHELDQAVAGAVDLSCEPVHKATMDLFEPGMPVGDAAVAFLLCRASDVARWGAPVLAWIDDCDAPETEAPAWGAGAYDLARVFGRAWAADGLVHVAGAIAAYHARLRAPDRVSVPGLDGLRRTIVLERAPGAPLPLEPSLIPPPTKSLDAHLPAVQFPLTVTEERRVSHLESGSVVMFPDAPILAPTTGGSAPAQPSAPSPGPREPIVLAPPQFAQPTTPPQSPLVQAPQGVGSGAAFAVQQAMAQLTQAHAEFVRIQSEAHARFLATRSLPAQNFRASTPVAVRAAIGTPKTIETQPQKLVVPSALPTSGLPPAPISPAPKPAPVVQSPTPAAAKPVAPPAVTAGVSLLPPKPGTRVATPALCALPDARELPGLKLDRDGLLVHASGEISTIFGPAFAGQDGFERQVRMPEPPLLLADRLLGIEAEPHKLGVGRLWTETDVGSQTWYLHQGRIPAGVMIEAGQADLMLISWMGIDAYNRSERVYRLLGCTLTYHRELPVVGDTLRYEIHADGHAKHGDIRLFFFHYDCVDQAGRGVLSVRGGQAGFFTREELAESEGVLWDAETGEFDAHARLDPPDVACTRESFGPADLRAFADGDTFGCFGPGFEFAQTHNDTPRIAGGRMLFFDHVTHCESRGGPWKRGYLRATRRISPDDWFFKGHFKNDPCMPGTLMFEGCLQALAFFATSLGYSLKRDGWRYEPVPGNPIPMVCRGQVLPENHELVYEVFVEEVHAGPVPVVYADLLVTVDGLKAFHARRCGLHLTPAWPLDHLRTTLLAGHEDTEQVAVVDGFKFGYEAMLACAWGRPSDAFGPMYAPFDGPKPVPRLPGDPYHFITRCREVEGPIGGMKVGTRVVIDYDIPEDAWYFDRNGAEVMPFCVLLEAALQPCGWLASYVGSALTTQEPLFFRNLDGTGTLHTEPTRKSGTMRTAVTLTSISKSGGMIIQSFDVQCTLADAPLYTLKTVFGFFPAKALADQKGLPFTPDESALAMSEDQVPYHDFRAETALEASASLRLPDKMLCMLDRIVAYDPHGGKAGLGTARSMKDVDPAEWFFKAHFFQDPVQPGSLGLEAMLQVLQWVMIERGEAKDFVHPRFEPLALDVPMSWKYRGQVTPTKRKIAVTLEVDAIERHEGSVLATATASLWCDGLRIYEATGFGMRIVEGPPADARGPAPAATENHFDASRETWLADHAPTWTVPSLPLASVVDCVIGAATASQPANRVVALEDVTVTRWLTLDRPLELRADVQGEGQIALHERRDGEDLGVVSTARAHLALDWPAPPALPEVSAQSLVADPYEEGTLFHGPSFRALRDLRRDHGSARGFIDLDALSVPRGHFGQGVLDVWTHVIPHDALEGWMDGVPAGRAAYPLRWASLAFYGEIPTRGRLEVRAQAEGLVQGLPMTTLWLATESGRVLAVGRLVEVLVPKGPIGQAAARERLAFLKERRFVSGVGLGRHENGQTTVRERDVQESAWLPGTLEAVYGLAPGEPRLDGLAIREHAAHVLRVHPGSLDVQGDLARSEAWPLNPVRCTRTSIQGGVRVTGEAPLELDAVVAWWSAWFGIGPWPLEDLDYALIERFVQGVELADARALQAVHGRPILFLGNHETAVESLLFSILAGALTQIPCVTIAKAEHRTTWLGRLIREGFAYPGITDPKVITFFDRDDKASLQKLIGEIAQEMAAGTRSAMVHVEGTRAFAANHLVQKMSGAFIDMALAVRAPIVPVRFTGGLPVEPLEVRTEFPVGFGRQTIHIGAPILPETLEKLDYKRRKDLVVAGINGLGPQDGAEVPSNPDPAFAAACRAWQAAHGVSAEDAVLAQCLLQSTRRAAPGTRRLVAALETGDFVGLAQHDDEAEAWLFALAQRLGGSGEG